MQVLTHGSSLETKPLPLEAVQLCNSKGTCSYREVASQRMVGTIYRCILAFLLHVLVHLKEMKTFARETLKKESIRKDRCTAFMFMLLPRLWGLPFVCTTRSQLAVLCTLVYVSEIIFGKDIYLISCRVRGQCGLYGPLNLGQ